MRSSDSRQPVLAVTLVSANDPAHALSTAALLAGRSPGEQGVVLDVPGVDSEGFAELLMDDLAREADDGRTGLSVVALHPEADVMEVALILEHLCASRHPLDTRIQLLDVVAVTSTREVLDVLCAPDASAADGTCVESRSSSSDLDAAERLAARIEFSNLIVLDDPLIGDEPRAEGVATDSGLISDLLRAMAPSAELIAASARPRDRRLVPHRAHRLAASMGWQCALNGVAPRAGTAVDEFVFRDPRPFHPGRLEAAIEDELVASRVGRIVRSRGLVRLATRAERVGSWTVAGDVVAINPTSLLSWDADAPSGQEIAFFGIDLDTVELSRVLGDCLLTPDELLAGPDHWASLTDPFPKWVEA